MKLKVSIEKLRFFKNNKIITPTPKQVLKNAGVVVGFSFIMGAFVWLVDTAAYGMITMVMSVIG